MFEYIESLKQDIDHFISNPHLNSRSMALELSFAGNLVEFHIF
jgi:hypothetical protein